MSRFLWFFTWYIKVVYNAVNVKLSIKTVVQFNNIELLLQGSAANKKNYLEICYVLLMLQINQLNFDFFSFAEQKDMLV